MVFKNPSAISELKRELGKRHPDLTLVFEADVVHLRGTFPIFYQNAELDRFKIDITIPNEFPKEIPIVRELGSRVPPLADWHAFQDGNLCVIVPEEWLLKPNSGSICDFLEGPVRNFFLNHFLAENGIQRPMGERDHGSKGLLQSYGELLNSTDPKAIKKYLDVLSSKRIKFHWACPCGSGQQIWHCHHEQIKGLRARIPRWIALKAYKRLADQMGMELRKQKEPLSNRGYKK